MSLPEGKAGNLMPALILQRDRQGLTDTMKKSSRVTAAKRMPVICIFKELGITTSPVTELTLQRQLGAGQLPADLRLPAALSQVMCSHKRKRCGALAASASAAGAAELRSMPDLHNFRLELSAVCAALGHAAFPKLQWLGDLKPHEGPLSPLWPHDQESQAGRQLSFLRRDKSISTRKKLSSRINVHGRPSVCLTTCVRLCPSLSVCLCVTSFSDCPIEFKAVQVLLAPQRRLVHSGR